MSSLQNINLHPKLTSYLVSQKIFLEKPLIVVDVGARGGKESHWRVYEDQIKIIGFDPDKKECARLNKLSDEINVRYFPYALWETSGTRKFYMMRNLASSSFFKPKIEFWKRFPDEVNLTTRKIASVKTINLDSFTNEQGVDYVDFIKLDVEGAELAALKGATNLLKKSVLGVTCEIQFIQTLKHQPVFAEVDSFLRSFGFVLFDLGLIRLGRKALSTEPGSKDNGQVLAGHALYLRDGAGEILNSGKLKGWWDKIKVLKLASIFELFGLNDCAIELIQMGSKVQFLNHLDNNYLARLLVQEKGLKRKIRELFCFLM